MDYFVVKSLRHGQYRRGGQRPAKRAPFTGNQLHGMGLHKLMGTVKYPTPATSVRSSLKQCAGKPLARFERGVWKRAGEGWNHAGLLPMKVLLTVLLLVSLGPAQNAPVALVIQTEFGDIEAEIDTARAPRTAVNFLRYVDGGLYDGGNFHRTVQPDNQPNNDVKIEVIQAGRRSGTAGFPPVALERTSVTGLIHRDGTLSMARSGPDSAVSDFFICIGDQPSLDFGGRRNPDGQGFAAFGRVTKGMDVLGIDVVRRIQARPSAEQRFTPPVRILKIARKLQVK